MGVNDLSDADKYAKDVNYWAAVWSARGAQIYYASVNPVWANSYGMTEERVKLFNDRLKGQLIPQIIWLDSHDYLMSVGSMRRTAYTIRTIPISYCISIT